MAAPNSELQVAPGYRIALLVALSMILAGCGKTTSVETPQDKIQLSPNRTRPANFAQPKAAAETFFHAAASANENRIAECISLECEPDLVLWRKREATEEQLKSISSWFVDARFEQVKLEEDRATVEFTIGNQLETMELLKTEDGWKITSLSVF